MKSPLNPILTALWIGLTLAACGEVKTPRDVELARNREQVNQRLSEIQPLLGEYEGTLYDARSDRKSRFRLNVVLAGRPYDSSNVPDETTAPTLSATALYYALDAAAETYVSFRFDRSNYDPTRRQLIFYSSEAQGSMSAKVAGDRLTGSWYASSRGYVGEFDVKKR